MPSGNPDVTELLCRWGNGDRRALDELIPIVYRELRRLGSRLLRSSAPSTLQTTALVHEAYLRLVDQNRARWQNRAQFFAVCANLMRRILVDHARRSCAAKRGGRVVRLTLDEELEIPAPYKSIDLQALDEALEELSRNAPREAQIVELRFFGGLSIEEAAAVLGVSPATVGRDWRVARAWLYQRLNPQTTGPDRPDTRDSV